MRRNNIAFLVSGSFFGLLVGWIIGTQQAAPAAPAVATTAAAPTAAGGPTPQPPPLDVARAAQLERQAQAKPADVAVRVDLGNLYFDAERFDQAIPYYAAALKLDPKNVNVSTDLAVAYYYGNQIDLALQQFDVSLKVDPKHLKTLLNLGIVRAFGKQDLEGAGAAWQKVVELAPDSEEGKRAKQGLDGLRAAHQTGGAGGATPSSAAPAAGGN